MHVYLALLKIVLFLLVDVDSIKYIRSISISLISRHGIDHEREKEKEGKERERENENFILHNLNRFAINY